MDLHGIICVNIKTNNLINWPVLPDKWQHQSQAVDLFAIDLELPPISIEQASKNLSDLERQRVNRFKSTKRQHEFTLTRGLLRIILASIIKQDPLAIQFEHTAQGKPFLPGNPVHFNVSHSQSIAIIAICPNNPIGIDIEYMQPRDAYLKLAQRFFATAEYQAICQLPMDQQLDAFHKTWTRKEAFVKATASGIAFGLDRFEVNVDPTAPAQLLRKPQTIKDHWTLHDLTPSPATDYTACLCYQSANTNINCWQLESSPCFST